MTPEIYKLANEIPLLRLLVVSAEREYDSRVKSMEAVILSLADRNAELEKLILDIYLNTYSENPMEKFDDPK